MVNEWMSKWRIGEIILTRQDPDTRIKACSSSSSKFLTLNGVGSNTGLYDGVECGLHVKGT
jgi:hypothetical protein